MTSVSGRNAKQRVLAAALLAWWLTTSSCSAGSFFPVASSSSSSSSPSTPVSQRPRRPPPALGAFAFGPFATNTNLPPARRARPASKSRARRRASSQDGGGNEASPSTTDAGGTGVGRRVGFGVVFDDGAKVKDGRDDGAAAVPGRSCWPPRPTDLPQSRGKEEGGGPPSSATTGTATTTDRRHRRRLASEAAEEEGVSATAGWKRAVLRRAATTGALAVALSTSLVLLGGLGGVSEDATPLRGGFRGDDGCGSGRGRCQRVVVSSVTPALFVRPAAAAQVAPSADVGVKEFLVKDANQLLRLSLPTSLPMSSGPEAVGDSGRAVQECVELVRLRLEQFGKSGMNVVWNSVLRDVSKARMLLVVASPDGTGAMLRGIPSESKEEGEASRLLGEAKDKLDLLAGAVRKRDVSSTLRLQQECSRLVSDLRSLSLKPGELPFDLPGEYAASLPQLRGRAMVEMTLAKKGGGVFALSDGSSSREAVLELTIDGYRAPLTGGNFVDLVRRGFYDDMPIHATDDLFVHTGRPTPGGEDGGFGGEDGGGRRGVAKVVVDGFIDPNTMEKRTVPLELFYKGDVAPAYGYTSDDDMRASESFALPFQAYGALGMAHDDEDVNTGSSQFWFLKWDQALVTPSRNTLDGRSCCFGYVTKNQYLLSQLEKDDLIQRMKVVHGGDNLFLPKKAKQEDITDTATR